MHKKIVYVFLAVLCVFGFKVSKSACMTKIIFPKNIKRSIKNPEFDTDCKSIYNGISHTITLLKSNTV
jgi:hypothetical protein